MDTGRGCNSVTSTRSVNDNWMADIIHLSFAICSFVLYLYFIKYKAL
jgi:hypothetical protein